MPVSVAQPLVFAVSVYFGLGLVFAIPFVLVGSQRIDPAAREATWGFRLIIVPGVCALWPLLAWRWLRGVPEPPPESNAHRQAAKNSRLA